MSFTIGATTFSETHGHVFTGPFDAPVQRTMFPGAKGEIELRDKIKGRGLAIPYLVEASSIANLTSELNTLHQLSGQLHGTLTIDSTTFANVTFQGFVPDGRIFKDQSSGNWLQRGTIMCRQIGPATT